MPTVLAGSLSLDAPEGWTQVEDKGRLSLTRAGGHAVQVSVVEKPPERRGAPSEKSVLSWVWRVADRMSGGRVRNGTVESIDGFAVLEAEAWRVGETVCAWLDLPEFEDDAGQISGWRMAVGFREWEDAGVLFTWIASEKQPGPDPDIRAMFASIVRAF